MPTLPKRVFFAWNYLEWGGAQTYFLAIARQILAECEVIAVMPAGSDRNLVTMFESQGVGIRFAARAAGTAPADGVLAKIALHARKIRAEAALLEALRDAGPEDVVHADLSPWQSVGALALLARRTNVFATMHTRLGDVSGGRRAMWRLKLGLASRLRRFRQLASNQDAQDCLAGLAPASMLERVRIGYSSIDPTEFEAALQTPLGREAAFSRLGFGPDAFLVVTVGQFIDRKGRSVLLEAARVLPQSSFAWITNTPIGAEEEALVESFGLGGRFRLVPGAAAGGGHLELMKVIREADVFALPSMAEGLPIALLEAMALGVPTVSSRVNAVPEAVTDGETGILVPAGDAKALAEAIGRLQSDREAAARIGEAGRARALAVFDERVTSKAQMEIYREAFGQRAGGDE